MKTSNLFFQTPSAKQLKKLNRFVFVAVAVTTLLLLLLGAEAKAQNVGVNTTGNTPNTSALLDIDASPGNNLGLLIPRVTFAERTGVNYNPLPQVAQGLVVYQTNAAGGGEGFYYNTSITLVPNWVKLSSGTAWSLTGNAGTVDGTNFLGTTDDVALNFKVGTVSKKAGRIDPLGPLFLGVQAGNSNTATGTTGIGYQALYSNTTGEFNTAIGYQALYSNNTGGFQNTAIGHSALYSNILGTNNTACGFEALYTNNADYNTAFGRAALYSNNSGTSNTASGYMALYANSIGNNNTAFGRSALRFNTSDANTATGNEALYNNNGGSGNVANGYRALFTNTSGLSNIAIGYQALYSNNVGNFNTVIGPGAGYSSTGSGNVFIGNSAGANELGSSKLYVDNSNTATPLIYGDFSTDIVTINNNLIVSGLTASSPVFTNASKQLTSAGTLGVGNGGTGTATVFTQGSVIFAGASGVYTQDNANFFFDDATNSLCLGTTTSVRRLTITGDQQTSGFGRFIGWNAEGGGAGLAAEIGVSAAVATIQSYNRTTATFGPLTLSASIGGIKIGVTATGLTCIRQGPLTVNPPSIAANTSAVVSMAIAAATTDLIFLTPPALIEGGLVFQGADINPVNVLNIRLRNVTGAAIDGAALIWSSLVITP